MEQELQFLLYDLPDDSAKVQVVVRDETVWMTQKAMGVLFGVETNTINYHLKEIFRSNELTEDSVVRKIRITAADGKNYDTNFYHLDAIISVGYRVNSTKATRFRQWATKILNEYIRKGFALNDERLKQGKRVFGQDYFRELLERIRSIRASERRIWQQITDIYAECSIDYDPKALTTKEFYAMVQNKFHYAITGRTAAEIIYHSADHTQEHMGLTTWKNSPDGRILKSDVTIAKNYLSEQQIRQLERAVTGYFDYIEDMVERGNAFTMSEFANSVNEFLSFRKYEVLPHKGLISREAAEEKAHAEYEIYNRTQPIESDFDHFLELEAEVKKEKE